MVDSDKSTILIDKRVIEILKQAKEHPRQTYNELLEKMALTFMLVRERNEFNTFVGQAQQSKMEEIWK